MVCGVTSLLSLYSKAQVCGESTLYNHLSHPGRAAHYFNQKTPEERPPPFPEDVKRCCSNTPNPQMYLGFPETLEGTLEIIMWDIHIHLSLQYILS